MPTAGSAWNLSPSDAAPHRSVFGTLKSKLSRKNSNTSTLSATSTRSRNTRTPSPSNNMGNPFAPEDAGRNPFQNPSPATRRPDRPGMNAFTVPSNEPPPAYTPSPVEATAQSFELPGSSAGIEPPAAVATHTAEDPYSFLGTFDTTLLIDDSGSMAGRSWREVSQALSTIAPIVTKHDSDGIDIYFLNHKSSNQGAPQDGVAAGGYRGIKRAATITEIFDRVRPGGGTPTGIRIHNILKPYLAKLDSEMAAGRELKPLNLIVLTDGVPSDDVESVLLSAAKKLDKLDAPPFQVGVQFFQVGNEEGAKEALEELDDGISELVEGGVRDMVDTVTWTGGCATSEGGVGLTGDGILKTVLGAVVKRLDRRRASGEVRRS
ncbi:hypothetical protein BDZ45DRAFT_667556 [Acephala macrosclerotiorum]|nr:hypothetical protein BDZ45DRAFT_667556 [Acephala macrosclerotiorum]